MGSKEAGVVAVSLEIYVDRDCFVCRASEGLAAGVQAEFPDVGVHVIDLGGPGGEHRHLVVATPTYILNGRVFSLGNPAHAELHGAIRRLRDEAAS